MATPLQTAKRLRQRMTRYEKCLWRQLRAHRFKGYKCRRQHPIVYQVFGNQISFYVADFYIASKKVVIELDGKHHQFSDQRQYDNARDKMLNEFGIKVLRIRNEELKDLEAVLTQIEYFLEAKEFSSPPAPLHKWRGETSAAIQHSTFNIQHSSLLHLQLQR